MSDETPSDAEKAFREALKGKLSFAMRYGSAGASIMVDIATHEFMRYSQSREEALSQAKAKRNEAVEDAAVWHRRAKDLQNHPVWEEVKGLRERIAVLEEENARLRTQFGPEIAAHDAKYGGSRDEPCASFVPQEPPFAGPDAPCFACGWVQGKHVAQEAVAPALDAGEPAGICTKRGLPSQAHLIPHGKTRCVVCFPEDELGTTGTGKEPAR